MAKFQLDIDYDYDFFLIGINTVAGDYRLCWNINKLLNINLVKEAEPHQVYDKTTKATRKYYYYRYFDEDTQVSYSLIANKNTAAYLVPEQKSADYLLLVQENFAIDVIEILKKIKEIKQVIMAFTINVEVLKSKQNLLLPA